jgi:hypothetical protein
MISTQQGGTISQSFQQNQIGITGKIDNTKKLNFNCDANIAPNTTVILQAPPISGELSTTNSRVVANNLATTGATINISGANAPTTGQLLTATNLNTANWQTSTGLPSGTGIVEVNNGVASTVSNLSLGLVDSIGIGIPTFSTNAVAYYNISLGNGALANLSSNSFTGYCLAFGPRTANKLVGNLTSGIIAIGYEILKNLEGTSSVNNNTGIGYNTCQGTYLNGAQENVVIGVNTGNSIVTASLNSVMGFNSMPNNSDQTYNTCIGTNSGASSYGMSYASLIGANTNTDVSNLTNVVCLGYGTTCSTSNTCVLGNGQSVVLGSDTPDPSALLTLTSTTKGVLTSRLETFRKNNIVSPASGLIVYDIDLKKLCYYNGSSWITI